MPTESQNDAGVDPGESTWPHPLDIITALAGGAWGVLAAAAGALGMYDEWSWYDSARNAIETHAATWTGPTSDQLTLASGVVFLVWFPVTAVWLVTTVAGLLARSRTSARKLHATVVAVLFVGMMMLLTVTSTVTSDAAHPELLNARFQAAGMLVLGGLGAVGLSIWFFRQTTPQSSDG